MSLSRRSFLKGVASFVAACGMVKQESVTYSAVFAETRLIPPYGAPYPYNGERMVRHVNFQVMCAGATQKFVRVEIHYHDNGPVTHVDSSTISLRARSQLINRWVTETDAKRLLRGNA